MYQMRGEYLSYRYALKGDTTMTIQSIPNPFAPKRINSEVPIYDLLNLVSPYVDIDQSKGPHRYSCLDDTPFNIQIPYLVFDMCEVGSRNKNIKIIVLIVEFITLCVNPNYDEVSLLKFRDDFIKNVRKQFD